MDQKRDDYADLEPPPEPPNVWSALLLPFVAAATLAGVGLGLVLYLWRSH